ARLGAPEGALVLADVQASGRGRQGRSWVSPAGNLHVSVLFRPGTAAAPLLPLAAGVAVAEGLAPFGVRARLKWPNDVMVDERKLGGILAESSTTGAALEWVVVGLGLNVRGELPPELRAQAISLRDAGATIMDVDAVAASVLGRLAVWYHRLAEGGPSPVVSAWRERAVPWWGGRVVALSEEGRVEGRAIDVDEAGGLVLEMDDGTRKILRSGEVSRARAAG
ncbi:MAG TPA: biotin--[acetyl-CoA-carboxylase] ligase, partial [Vicinamibacteria bacterium]|nr:biotin--[acetyl-CoA-carboxylase] ligase [Vicinamibacteria bacterium]